MFKIPTLGVDTFSELIFFKLLINDNEELFKNYTVIKLGWLGTYFSKEICQ